MIRLTASQVGALRVLAAAAAHPTEDKWGAHGWVGPSTTNATPEEVAERRYWIASGSASRLSELGLIDERAMDRMGAYWKYRINQAGLDRLAQEETTG